MNSDTQTLASSADVSVTDARENESRQQSGKLSLASLFSYSLPALAPNALLDPVLFILPGIYAKYFGLELTVVAAVLLAARLCDGVTDLVIGHYSDRSRERYGTRKPWVITGGVMLALTAWFLFVPPQDVSTTYYLFWFVAFILAWTLFDIPHMAWGAEIATGYHERSRMYGYRGAFAIGGTVMFYALPFLPVFPSPEFTPDTLKVAVLVCIAILLPSLYVMARVTPNGETIKSQRRSDLRELLRAIVGNKPLMLFGSANALWGIGGGMWSGLLFVYLDSYLQLGEHLATFYLLGTAIAVATIPLWLQVIRRVGKKIAWAMCVAFYPISFAGYIFVEPGDGVTLPLALSAINFLGFGCLYVVTPAVLADIVDYGTWKYRHNQAATYFAFYCLIKKISIGLGTALGLGIAGYFGFDPAVQQQSDTALFGLHLAFIYMPVATVLCAIIFILLSPVNKRRHDILRRRIERVQSRNPDKGE